MKPFYKKLSKKQLKKLSKEQLKEKALQDIKEIFKDELHLIEDIQIDFKENKPFNVMR